MSSFIKPKLKNTINMSILLLIFVIAISFSNILLISTVIEEKIGYKELLSANEIKEYFEVNSNTPKKIYFKKLINTYYKEIIEKKSTQEVTIVGAYGGGVIPYETTDKNIYNVYILEGGDYNIIYLSENEIQDNINSVNVKKYAISLNEEIKNDYINYINNDKQTFVLYENVSPQNVKPIVIVSTIIVIILLWIYIKQRKARINNSSLGKEIIRYGGKFKDTYRKILEEEKNAVIKNARMIIGRNLIINLTNSTNIINIKDIKEELYYKPDEKYPKDIFNVLIYHEETEKSKFDTNIKQIKLQTYSEEEAIIVINEINNLRNKLKK